jgi:hypothetical protein
MAKSHLKLVAPRAVNRTVTPTRLPNADLRTREYLTEAEVERLMTAAKKNRWGHRDATVVLVAYRHGLRASELVDLRWDQVDFRTASLHVRRVKQGTPSTHPILGDELRALRRLQREQEPKSASCSPRSAARHSRPQGSPAWSREQEPRPSLASRLTRTCSGTLAVTRWRTEGTTLEPCRLTSDTATSNTRYATQKCPLPALRTFGGPNPHLEAWISPKPGAFLAKRAAIGDPCPYVHRDFKDCAYSLCTGKSNNNALRAIPPSSIPTAALSYQEPKGFGQRLCANRRQ